MILNLNGQWNIIRLNRRPRVREREGYKTVDDNAKLLKRVTRDLLFNRGVKILPNSNA